MTVRFHFAVPLLYANSSCSFAPFLVADRFRRDGGEAAPPQRQRPSIAPPPPLHH